MDQSLYVECVRKEIFMYTIYPYTIYPYNPQYPPFSPYPALYGPIYQPTQVTSGFRSS